MKNFLIVTNRKKDTELSVTKKMKDYIEKKNGIAVICHGSEELEQCDKIQEMDCAIVIGGDGTMLRAVTLLVAYSIPIVGVNLGTVGFLTEVEVEEIETVLQQLFENNYEYKDRMMLEGTVYRDEKQCFQAIGINDIVVNRSGFSTIVAYQLWINDEYVASYRADGILVATPTGSTGYNLSAGGAIVSPNSSVFIITPICPHSFMDRSIVVSKEDKILIKIDKIGQKEGDEAYLMIDGHTSVLLKEGDSIQINLSKLYTRFLSVRSKGFYEVLRRKMG